MSRQKSLLEQARRFSAPHRVVIRLGSWPLIGTRVMAGLIESSVFKSGNSIGGVYRDRNLSDLMDMIADHRFDYALGPDFPGQKPVGKFGSVQIGQEPMVIVLREKAHIRQFSEENGVLLKQLVVLGGVGARSYRLAEFAAETRYTGGPYVFAKRKP